MEQLWPHGLMLLLALAVACLRSLRLDDPVFTRLRLPRDERRGEGNDETDYVQALTLLQQALGSNLLMLNLFGLALLACRVDLFQAIIFGLGWTVVVNLLAASSAIRKFAQPIAVRRRVALLHLALALEPVLKLLDNLRFFSLRKAPRFTSRSDMHSSIMDSDILSPGEKRQMLAVLNGSLAAETTEIPTDDVPAAQ